MTRFCEGAMKVVSYGWMHLHLLIFAIFPVGERKNPVISGGGGGGSGKF